MLPGLRDRRGREAVLFGGLYDKQRKPRATRVRFRRLLKAVSAAQAMTSGVSITDAVPTAQS
jgi:hypothetical protein